MLALVHCLLILSIADDARPFAIEVVDDATGRGVPLVVLTTTSGMTFVTDSAGLIAFDEPGLMDQTVYFEVQSHGYEIRKDGFGFPGVRLETKAGGSATVKLKRINIAERLYRVTGQGTYRDSVLLGRETPTKQPLLNAKVAGQDSVQNAIYRGKLRWFWGDTTWPAYPLGNFHMPGATSDFPDGGGLDPARGVDLTYFVGENGFARGTAQMPGEGPTWIGGVAVLPDKEGRERLLCGYAKIKPPLSVYRRGIAQWNDETDRFERLADFETEVPLFPDGHPFRAYDPADEHLYFASPYPLVRVRASAESYCDLTQHEAFTCLKPGTTLDAGEVDRDAEGKLRYAWKKNTPPVGPQEQAKLIRSGKLKAEEALLHLRDAVSGKPVIAHAGSVNWNDFRKRYVLITCELFGTSALGETWYAEADSPTGPWVYATKIVTHHKYSFYNPKQHPYFDQEDGRRIYFEGTYTHTFSGNEQRTPRYDYNQIMYRLDLADDRLALPVPVTLTRRPSEVQTPTRSESEGFFASSRWNIRFFALDRPRAGAVALSLTGGRLLVSNEPTDKAAVLCYALPADAKEPPAAVPLYEYLGSGPDNPPIYDVRDDLQITGYQRCPLPLCRVWPSPYRVSSP